LDIENRVIFDKIGVALFIFDLETYRILDANQFCTDLYGYSRDELLALTMTDLCLDDDAHGKFLTILNGKTKHTNIEFQGLRHQKKDGTSIWVSITCSTVELDSTDVGIAIAHDVTDHAKLGRKLTERSKYLEALIRDAPDAIVTLDKNHNIREWNPGATRLLGYSPEEAVGKNIDNLIARNDVTAEAQRFTKTVLNGGEITPHASIRYRKDGSPVPVIVSGSPIILDGELIGVIALYKDISEQKKAEEDLRISQERFQQVAENSQEWIWEVDQNGLYTYSSPVVIKLLGYEPEEIVGKKHFYDLFHPDDREKLKNAAFKAFSRKQSFKKFLNRNVRKDGETVWMSTSGVPILNKNGNLMGYRGADSDITKQLLAEKALKESEARYRQLADAGSELGQCVVVIQTQGDRLGLIRYANDATCRLLGYSREELYTKSFQQLVEPDMLSKITDRYHRRQRGETVPEKYEVIARNRDGRQILVEAMMKAIEYEGEIATIAFFKDITHQRALKEQLQQSQKLEAIGLLASGVAHNINTPLSAIIGYCEIMQLTGNDSKEVDAILSQANSIKDIVSNLMIKSSYEQESEATDIDINKLLETELKFFEANMHYKHNVEKDFHLSPNIPKIQGIYSDFSQSLLNIISNATDAMYYTDQKTLTIRTFQDNGKICVEVKDTGEGIPPENMHRIMEPFFTTKPKRGEQEPGVPAGTGLGLYSAHQLLSKYNAEINIESQEGKGSTVTVSIPCPND
jgi:PAS domain S-box-containing protein